MEQGVPFVCIVKVETVSSEMKDEYAYISQTLSVVTLISAYPSFQPHEIYCLSLYVV
jgi:hypothetical protein